MNIVVFDIENVFNDLLRSAFGDGQSVRATDDIFTAKEYLMHGPADAIFIAVRSRDGNDNGMDLLRTMNASGLDMPAIILMAVSDVNLAVECVKLKARNVIALTGDQSADLAAIQKSAAELLREHQGGRAGDRNREQVSLLLVDDDEIFSRSLSMHLESSYRVDILNDFTNAEAVAAGSHDFIFLDIRDEENNNPKAGIELLQRIMAIQDNKRIIMLSGWADTATAVECLKQGATDFMEKSADINETLGRIEGIIRKYTVPGLQGGAPQGASRGQLTLIDLVGECGAMKKIRNDIIRIADHDVPVVVYGETGTGKEVVASAIHAAGARRNKKFVIVNCGSIPESIFESEMFGYKKGSFTGATADRTGKMEAAHGGTLFLDEIEALSPEQQVKLLRVLEDKKIYPVGSAEGTFADFRLICATNVELSQLVREGLFRQDLYFRLIVIHLELPPVRERGEKDIEFLVKHFLLEFGDYTIENGAMELLIKYSWPGNVRELKNLIRRFVIIALEGSRHTITLDMVKEGFKKSRTTNNPHQLIEQLLDHFNGNIATIIKRIEDTAVLKAFKDNNGNLSRTAQQLFKETPDDTRDHRDKVRAILERNKDLL